MGENCAKNIRLVQAGRGQVVAFSCQRQDEHGYRNGPPNQSNNQNSLTQQIYGIG